MRGRVGGPKIVHRLDQPSAHQVIPDEIDLRPRECRVPGARQPVGQKLAAVRVRFHLRRVGAEKTRHGVFAGPRIPHFADIQHADDLVADKLVLVQFVLALVFDNLVVDPREQRRPLVIVVLRPAIERVVVALSALQSHALEQAADRFRPRDRIAQRTIKVRRRRLVRAAPRHDQLADELVERFAVRDARADPTVKAFDARRIERLFLDPQHVAPSQRPAVREFGPRQHPLHQTQPLIRTMFVRVERIADVARAARRHRAGEFARVGEFAGVVGARQDAEEVQRQAANQRGVIGGRRRPHSQPLPTFAPQLIQRRAWFKGRQVGGRPIWQECDSHRHLLVQVANDHGGLAKRVADHGAAGVNSGH